MKRCATSALPEIVWALGRIAHNSANGPLLDYLTSEDEPIRSAAAVALARIGEPRAIDSCLDQARSNTWPMVTLGLASGRSALRLLTELAEKKGSADCLIALGLLGDPVSIPLLISRLAEPATAAPVATALQCLTGAGIHETVFVPDEIDDDELFESEREQLKQGKKPDRGDGRPFGSTVTRLSQNPEDWKRWWQTNAARFTPGVRYRNGEPFSPARLVEALTDESTPYQLRQYCSEELATRYQYDFGFETDMPVSCQINKLAEAVAWSKTGGAQFQEGEWYFGGHRCA
jgi:HEAT repeat protein